MSTLYTDKKLWAQSWKERTEKKRNIQSCSRCLYDADTPHISFNEAGVCNYCEKDDEMRAQFPGGKKGEEEFAKIVDEIKIAGKGKKYDVIVGVSGGADSTYMLHLGKKYGLRMLAVHFDNTWNTTIAQQNIKNALEKLDVDLWTYVVNAQEYDDIYRAFLKSGTPDLEVPTDIALAAVLGMAAEKYGIQYIFEGHSFKTEGIAPVGWIYMDAKYIDSVHDQFGEKPMKTFPNFRFMRQLKWMLFNRIKKIRPLWYLDYNKEEAKALITKEYDWQWYGGHHLENRMTAFYHTYYLPRKFDIDMRALGYGGLIRSGQMSREEGVRLLETEPNIDYEIYDVVLKRLGFSEPEFEKIMMTPKKTYRDYKTYKKLFERLRPFYYVMAKMNLIPWSFYIKYTSKDNL